ncbi:hypothetical protein BJ138DRAFT_1077910 [Hygrophoropsis aurantiaca]|uniref:Uncharacterized protein n=1 Tax=Hygrophoropsis aurantiaca TaxID=72124 RepID=A0ACB8APB8_9AGAM|nr:hypothetical protein BJ138DRAFT_1077910 [Hygrophoropsis aurantiaca]
MTDICLMASSSSSVARRKAKVTYQSPSAKSSFIKYPALPRSTDRSYSIRASSSSSSPQPITPLTETVTTTFSTQPPRKRIKSNMGPPLPLYHPLGKLALSLPDLDPTTLGLPASLSMAEDSARRSSNRARRPAAKVRDLEETVISSVPFIDASSATGQDAKEVPSPRKRRGGPSGGSKRKRKEPEDGDASYPAKRPRNPRGVNALTTAARASTSEAVSPPQSIGHTAESPSVVDGPADTRDDKRPDRRKTRSRVPMSRRDSTASEATVSSVSVSIVASTTAPRNSGDNTELDASTRHQPQQDNGGRAS